MIQLYGHCWRGRADCEAVDCVHDTPEGLTEDQLHSLEFKPNSFVCCGVINEKDRRIPQDCYRMCFVSTAHGEDNKVDDMSDNDVQDLAGVMRTVSAAINFDSIVKVNSGKLIVPADEDGFIEVEAMNP